jgi:hypothetical protein
MSKPGAKRRNDFPADRVTIMISAAVDARIKMDLAKEITECAKAQCKMPSTSYSRIINQVIKKAFEKHIDKKVIAAVKS